MGPFLFAQICYTDRTFHRKPRKSGCGVTANMPALGAGDSGFESLHPDKKLILLRIRLP